MQAALPVKTLTIRIYLTVVAVLLLFAGASTWLFQKRMEEEQRFAEKVMADRLVAWGDLLQRSMPAADTPREEQAAALVSWALRVRLPLALDDAAGVRIAASPSYRHDETPSYRGQKVPMEDGRALWLMRPGPRPLQSMLPIEDDAGTVSRMPRALREFSVRSLFVGQHSVGLLALLLLLFVAVAAGAWPVVRRLTRRLQELTRAVDLLGAGRLDFRVQVSGRDEIARLAASFNQAASRIEALMRSNKSLLANASHELRSPLARMRMAVSMIDQADEAERKRLQREIDANIAELNALVAEVLLASKLEAHPALEGAEAVEMLSLATEEAARVQARTDGEPLTVAGDERLLRRALRNLLENAQRYGGDQPVEIHVQREGGLAVVRVEDRGPGVPAELRKRIFEAFYRLPGHAERAGGVGLGLSIVKQIAEHHGGHVRCDAREGGGSSFVITLPALPAPR